MKKTVNIIIYSFFFLVTFSYGQSEFMINTYIAIRSEKESIRTVRRYLPATRLPWLTL